MRAVFTTVALALVLTGCSVEQVPPAHKGKVLTRAGYKPDLVPPSRVTLWGFDKLVLVETGTATFKEPMTVLMSDRLELKFDVRGRVRLSGDTNVVHSMFDDITPDETGLMSVKKVYATYGRMLVRNKARAVLSAYTIDDVHQSYKELSAKLYSDLKTAFKGTPLVVSDVALGGLKFPSVVSNAVEAQKEREIAIGKERAQVEIELTKKRGEEQLAEADYRIRMVRAKTIRDENRTVSEGVTPEYLAYRRLEVMERMASNQSAVFIPFDAVDDPGAQIRMYQEKPARAPVASASRDD